MLKSLLTVVVGWVLGMIPWLLDRTFFQRPKIKAEIRDTFVRSHIGSSAEALECTITLKVFVVNLRDAPITIQNWSLKFQQIRPDLHRRFRREEPATEDEPGG